MPPRRGHDELRFSVATGTESDISSGGNVLPLYPGAEIQFLGLMAIGTNGSVYGQLIIFTTEAQRAFRIKTGWIRTPFGTGLGGEEGLVWTGALEVPSGSANLLASVRNDTGATVDLRMTVVYRV